MKRLLSLWAAILLFGLGIHAQQAELKRAALNRYKNVSTLVAQVKMTRHNAALTQDVVSKGYFYYKKPHTESMVFKTTKDMLLAEGSTYTMVKGGKRRVTKANGTGNNPFEVLRDVFANLFVADGNAQLTHMATVKLQKQGNTCTMTILPHASNNKAKRRMMYTSCVVHIDMKTAEIRTLCIYEKAGNYTQYDFSNYVLNKEVSSSVFNTQILINAK